MSRDEPHELPVWSSPIAVSEIPPHGADVVIEANPGQLEALATLNGIVALSSAAARLHIAHRGKDGLHVTGEVTARATLTCVVSLDDFEAAIVEPVDVEFVTPRNTRPVRAHDERTSRRRREARPPIDDEEEGMEDLDAPDEIVGGRIDLGALASEFLTLGIDPYPRKPGAAFDEPGPPPATVSPFAPLGARKADPGDKA